MEIYNYNNDGFYIGSNMAHESPLEPGVFLIPAKATTIEPPICEEGFAPQFDGEKWNIIDVSLQNEPITDPVNIPSTQAEQLIIENNQLKEQINELNGTMNTLIQSLVDKGLL